MTIRNTPENRCKAVAVAIVHAANELQALGPFTRQEVAAGSLTATAELLVAVHGRDAARRLLVRVADSLLDEQVSPTH
jgi:hypothetical protein